MCARAKSVVTAVLLTALGAAVLSGYGRVIWQAFSHFIWTRILLVLLFALLIATLMKVWHRAWYALRSYSQRLSIYSASPVEAANTTRGDGDV